MASFLRDFLWRAKRCLSNCLILHSHLTWVILAVNLFQWRAFPLSRCRELTIARRSFVWVNRVVIAEQKLGDPATSKGPCWEKNCRASSRPVLLVTEAFSGQAKNAKTYYCLLLINLAKDSMFLAALTSNRAADRFCLVMKSDGS